MALHGAHTHARFAGEPGIRHRDGAGAAGHMRQFEGRQFEGTFELR